VRHRHAAPDAGGAEALAASQHLEQRVGVPYHAAGANLRHHLPQDVILLLGCELGYEERGLESSEDSLDINRQIDLL
jgi:hypothetical protein